ncbi:MAG: DUF2064 domain-containing protein [Halorhabdus sp.]
MATVVIRADRPVEGRALTDLAVATPLTSAQAATLYRRAMGDVCEAVDASGADLLVTYPDDASEAKLRAVVDGAVEDPATVRFEPQVGSTPAAKMGNTVTHLLETEAATSVGVLDPTAVFVTRSTIDQAAMTLRRHDAVVGPAAAGAVYYAGFTDTIDFTDVYDPPVVETIVETATAADRSTAVLDPLPTLGTPSGLRSALPLLWARKRAGHAVPERTSEYVADIGLRMKPNDGEGRLDIVTE